MNKPFLWMIASVALVSIALLAYLQPGGSGVLSTLRLPDGSEYMVTQQCNWSVDPYTVSFYMRSKDGPWGWCYIDHEAARWRNVNMTYDDQRDVIVITERQKVRATLDRKLGIFWFDNGDGNPRGGKAPQVFRSP